MPKPDYSEAVDDIVMNGKCEASGITLDDVLESVEVDTWHYKSILKNLINHYSMNAKTTAFDFVRQLAYEAVERHYK
jgi:hypothetical protein